MDTESKAPQTPLKCDMQIQKGFIDFDFRSLTLFEVSADLTQFVLGRRVQLLLRITPAHGEAVLLGMVFRMPQVPPNVTNFQPKRFHVNVSGGFATGAGHYKVELLLLDHNRSRYKKWNIRVKNRSKDDLSALAPRTVSPLLADHWNGELNPGGFRLTVLLDATPPGLFSASFQERFLLEEMLASLLRHVPCASVRVVAFNIDQEKEIFRDDDFGPAGFVRLSTALKNLQVSVVSYRSLQRGNATKFLARLIQQVSAPSDAVIFMGANLHVREKPSEKIRESLNPGPARFFYFEYMGYRRVHFPDSIEYLTHDLQGTVFHINSVRDFGTALQRMEDQLKLGRRTSNAR